MPQILDCLAFEKLKTAHPTPDSRPGTMTEAYRAIASTLTVVTRAPYGSYDRWLPERLDEMEKVLDAHTDRHDPENGWCECNRRWKKSDKNAEVGSVNEVSRLFRDKHSVGSEVRTGPAGWTLERLEFLDSSLEVLRHNDQLMGAQRVLIHRMEFGHGINYV